MRSVPQANLKPLKLKLLFQILDVQQVADLAALDPALHATLLTWQHPFCSIAGTTHIARSSTTAIETASIPIDILWVVLSYCVGLSATVLLSLSAIGLVIALGLGGYCAYLNYSTIKKKIEQDQDYFRLVTLQLQVCNEVISRYGGKFFEPTIPVPLPTISKSKPIIKAITVAIIIFLTYYLGTSSVLTMLGCVSIGSAMMGPVGLAIAAVVAIGIGIFLGYQHYQANKHAQRIETKKEVLSEQLRHNYEKCYQLKKRSDTAKKITAAKYRHHLFNSKARQPQLIVNAADRRIVRMSGR